MIYIRYDKSIRPVPMYYSAMLKYIKVKKPILIRLFVQKKICILEIHQLHIKGGLISESFPLWLQPTIKSAKSISYPQIRGQMSGPEIS